MSDTTNDTSIIDEKKQEENMSSTTKEGTTLIDNIRGFITSLIIIILIILLYFSSSSLILFVCKLAQTNILPTEMDCEPYTDNKPNIEKIKTNIFTTSSEPEMSMKLEIPYDENNSKNKILDMFKDYKMKSSSNFLANYFISIVESLFKFDYSIINTSMNFLNNMPESVIIGLGPIVVSILFSFGILINILYFIYLWFANMSWLFKRNKNETGEGTPKWEDITIISPVNWVLAICLVILFIILFFIGFPFIIVIPFIAIFYTTFSCLAYKGTFNNKSITSFSLIKEVFKQYSSKNLSGS